MIDLAKKARAEHKEMSIAENTGINKANKGTYFHNLYHALLASNLPEDEKRPERMAHEGFEILLAGSDTTARTMGIAVYHLIANPHIVQNLREELKTVMPRPQDIVELKILEALPWLGSLHRESEWMRAMSADSVCNELHNQGVTANRQSHRPPAQSHCD